VLRNYGEFSVTTAYTETPLLFIIMCFCVVVILSVRAGIEVMGRISEIFIFLLTIVFLFVFIALTKQFDIENLKPFMPQGMKPILKTAFATLTFPFGETVVFLMIFPYVNKQKKIFKASLLSLTLVGVLLLSTIIRNIMVIGADMVSRDIFPSHIVFRLIPGIDVDPLLDINLIITGMIKVGICLYGATTGITELFNLDEYKPFVIPISALCVSLSIWVYRSLMEMLQWATSVWPYYSIPFQIVIPLILLLISLIKNKKQKI
jgi:spore germination protein KB